MYLVPIAWLYVTVMMAVAEANSPNGTVLGACITFLLYGAGPIALVMYVMGTPARRRAIKAQEAAERAAAQAQPSGLPLDEPNAGSHAPADAVPPVRKKP
jgi:hypothetical protein